MNQEGMVGGFRWDEPRHYNKTPCSRVVERAAGDKGLALVIDASKPV
ncbi:MAG: hypothetical protein J7L19_03420 [Dehalococcoidia bacterium]|nr:hypothetical protein [Dehalococcoidia bacterium]